jgi:hypothetical protein
MGLAVTVVPPWPVVLLLFITFALMDNVFEQSQSAPMLMAALLSVLIAVLMALVLRVIQLAPRSQLVLEEQLPVLMVLVNHLVLQVCRRMVAAPTRRDVLTDFVGRAPILLNLVNQWCSQIPALVLDHSDVQMDTVRSRPRIVLISRKMLPVRQASPTDAQICLVHSQECLVLLCSHAHVLCLVA